MGDVSTIGEAPFFARSLAKTGVDNVWEEVGDDKGLALLGLGAAVAGVFSAVEPPRGGDSFLCLVVDDTPLPFPAELGLPVGCFFAVPFPPEEK